MPWRGNRRIISDTMKQYSTNTGSSDGTRIFKRVLAVLFIMGTVPMIGLAQHNFISAQRPDAPELAALGTYPVGVRSLEFVHPDQLDFVNATASSVPRYDRPLAVEVWYPAAPDTPRRLGEYVVDTTDPTVRATLTGVAVRGAKADNRSSYPLIVLSHGYPGNRFLMSHLAENLASKGYVVAAIDHTDSTYGDQGAFSSTLYNRPIDQHFVIESLVELSEEGGGFLRAMIDGENVGVVGYSMGAYGAVIGTGGSVTDQVAAFPFAPPNNLLADHQADNEAYRTMLANSRVKAVFAFAPWGMNVGTWDAQGLSGIRVPFFFVVGDQDDVSGYQGGVRALWENTANTDRYLLTFENARHNAGAPIPAPVEITDPDRYMSYADNVWDSTRMNNIAQHFATAFFGIHLKGDDYQAYLDLIPNAVDGVFETDDEGRFTERHTYWKGFQARSALGLRLEYLEAGN